MGERFFENILAGTHIADAATCDAGEVLIVEVGVRPDGKWGQVEHRMRKLEAYLAENNRSDIKVYGLLLHFLDPGVWYDHPEAMQRTALVQYGTIPEEVVQSVSDRNIEVLLRAVKVPKRLRKNIGAIGLKRIYKPLIQEALESRDPVLYADMLHGRPLTGYGGVSLSMLECLDIGRMRGRLAELMGLKLLRSVLKDHGISFTCAHGIYTPPNGSSLEIDGCLAIGRDSGVATLVQTISGLEHFSVVGDPGLVGKDHTPRAYSQFHERDRAREANSRARLVGPTTILLPTSPLTYS